MDIPYLSIVMLEDWYREEVNNRNFYKFDNDNFFIYLGEIPNMLGHCVVVGYESGKIYSGYHIENFRLPTENEF
jgi:cell division protein FtsX